VVAAPVIAGLAVGIGFVVLFSMFIQTSPFTIDTPPVILLPKDVDDSTMPTDFDITYSIDHVQLAPVLDTKNNLYTHDMVCDPDLQIKLVLSEKELERIWQSVIDNDFFKMPSDLTKRCELYDNCIGVDPNYTSILNVTTYGQSHAVKYSTALLPVNDKYVKHYEQIQSTIWSVLDEREEVKEMPKPTCGYQ
jgi:hypothetical protein